MKKNKKVILKVLVGSRAAGLADDKSDSDYALVYVLPTKEILSLGYSYKGSKMIQGQDDYTMYEIGHFLHLSCQNNPTILEVYRAPIIEVDEDGDGIKLRELFPYIIDYQRAYDAFIGYGLNQRKKFLNKKNDRPHKYSIAYIRTLNNLCQLLETGSFDLEIKDDNLKSLLLRFKKGFYTFGEIIDLAEEYTSRATALLTRVVISGIDYGKANEFLLYIRKKYWEF